VVDRHRRDERRPVTLDVFDGETGDRQTLSATIVTGKYASDIDRPMDLEIGGGAPLCRGTYRMQGRAIDFAAMCFSKYRFTDQVKIRGYALSDGVYQPVFDFRLEHGKSYIAGRFAGQG
jgi:hypothetical protein